MPHSRRGNPLRTPLDAASGQRAFRDADAFPALAADRTGQSAGASGGIRPVHAVSSKKECEGVKRVVTALAIPTVKRTMRRGAMRLAPERRNAQRSSSAA